MMSIVILQFFLNLHLKCRPVVRKDICAYNFQLVIVKYVILRSIVEIFVSVNLEGHSYLIM